ncbi:MAG TPA: hemerythrin domain-containing protein [Acidobacteriaceae bacterium]|nr:hemerythrin domain-containing protein [Acidobacteriaceae bacterium]
MPVQIGAQPDSGFDDPLGMLRDCHRRIENFLRVLAHVAATAGNGALSAPEQSAVESALQYFRSGGQRHTQDEEESLFPRLPAAELQSVADLEREHREADELHAAVDRLFSLWLASGFLSAQDRQALRAATSRLTELYAGHIQLEETVVFPRAAQILSRETIAAIGEEFRARRSSS